MLNSISHFAFGAGAGTLCPLMAGSIEKFSIGKGITFGMGVWATLYIGALPSLGIMKPPSREVKYILLEEIASHVAWGAGLGWSAKALQGRARGLPCYRSGKPG
ncbi:MAG: DUF1440 domain-containing protein [Oligoflexus sp.]|nr:DUF1440 domain-containing protein [Oligoflexus sp.]